jgi:ChaB
MTPPAGNRVPEVVTMAEKRKQTSDVPSTVARSDDKAVRTYKKTLESAKESYGEGERARRTAMASLKHTHEKVGDHWEPKDEPGPSDEQAEQSGRTARERPRATAEGVNARATKAHLVEVAQKVGVQNPQSMTKADLVEAIGRANRRETRRAR